MEVVVAIGDMKPGTGQQTQLSTVSQLSQMFFCCPTELKSPVGEMGEGKDLQREDIFLSPGVGQAY